VRSSVFPLRSTARPAGPRSVQQGFIVGFATQKPLSILELRESEFDDPKRHAVVRGFREAAEAYGRYFERVEAIVSELSTRMPPDGLRERCLAWQAEKKSRAAKAHRRKKALEQEAADHRLLAAWGPIEDVESAAQTVFDRLDSNVRSSSPIESINALIRDSRNNSRGQVTQAMLDRIVYYLNHKVASRGPDRGTSAWERLTGESENGTVIDQILHHSKKTG
jgi:hypothetical protein